MENDFAQNQLVNRDWLASNTHLYRDIFANIGIGIAVISLDMRILLMNPKMQSWFPRLSTSEGPICYHSFNNPPRDAACNYCPVVRTLSDGQVHTALTETPTPGGIRSFRIISTPLYNPDGSIAAAIEMVEDLTAQAKADELKNRQQRELKKTQQWLNDIVLASSDWTWEVDGRGRYTFVSQQVVSILGYEPAEMIGKTPFDFMPEDEKQRVTAKFREFRNQMQPITNLENLNLHKSGHAVYLETNGIPVFDQRGEFRGYRGIDRDISRRKWSEQLLRLRLELAEFSNTRSLDEIIQLALDKAEAFTNSQIGFFHFVDADQETMSLGTWSTNTLDNICQAEGKGLHYPASQAGVWVDCLRQRQPVIHNDYASLPNRKGLPEGHAPVIRELTVPVMRDDLVVAIIGVGNKPCDYTLQDVEAVEQLASMAYDIVARKRAEETAEKLREGLALAQRLEAVGRLAGGVAHDFNNKLTVILGCADMLAIPGLSEVRRRECLADLVTAAEQSRDLTRQLLSFSRQESAPPQRLDLTPLITTSQRTLGRLLGEDIQLSLTVTDDLWPIHFDPTQFDQIFMNLAINARDAMPSGGQLEVHFANCSFSKEESLEEPGLLPGDFVCLTMTDSGEGIPSDILPNVFEPFFTTKKPGKGTGLGLAMVYSIITQRGGFIKVASEIGQGTSFKIHFPRSTSPIPIPPLAATASEKPDQSLILLIEDDDMVRHMVASMIEQLGHQVLSTPSPVDAVHLCHDQPQIELVISDVMMPAMNGHQLAARIRQEHPDKKILFISGYDPDHLTTTGLHQENTAFLHKPFNLKALQQVIDGLFNGQIEPV